MDSRRPQADEFVRSFTKTAPETTDLVVVVHLADFSEDMFTVSIRAETMVKGWSDQCDKYRVLASSVRCAWSWLPQIEKSFTLG